MTDTPNQHQEVEFRFGPGRTSACIVIPENADVAQLSVGALAECAGSQGVIIGATAQKRIEEAIGRFKQSPENIEIVIAESAGPVHGQDGHLLWAQEYDPAHLSDTESSDEAIDFYSSVNYVAIKSGMPIATVQQPTPGQPGASVTGERLDATDGRPLMTQIDEESIGVDDAGQLTAKVDGILEASEKRVAVSRLLEVSEYVDFSTGNIEFDGSVRVKLGVRDRFEVRATEAVVVEGLIEAATIVAGRGFVCRQGMAAKDRGELSVGGDAEVGYLNNVRGRVNENLSVQRELVNCELFVGGDVVGDRATILGGQIAIAGKVTIGTIGSGALIPTTLILGSGPQMERLNEPVDKLAAKLEQMQAKYEEGAANTKDLSHEQREELTEMTFTITELEEELEEARKVQQEGLQQVTEAPHIEAIIRQRIYPEARLIVGDLVMRFDKEVKGPVTICTNEYGRPQLKMLDGSYRRLTDFARELERAA